MSYRQKQAALTLLALCLVALMLLMRLAQVQPQTMREALPIFAEAGLAMIVIMCSANIALAIVAKMTGRARGDDERDQLIELAGRRNGYWFATIGLSLVVIQAIRGISVVGLAETALAGFLAAEAVVYGSRLYYYRRGL